MKGLYSLRTWIVLIFGFMLIGSGGAAYGGPIILKISAHTPPPIPHSRAGMWIVQEVEKRSKGQIKVEYYYSSSLIPAKETIAGLQDGVADMAFVNASYEPGRLPLSTVATLPATSPGKYYPTAKAVADLYKMPEMKAEIDQYNIMYIGPLSNTSYGIWSKKQIRSLADLKGLKVLATGEHATLMKTLGAVPVSMVSPEAYAALQKGILDGGLANPTMGIGYKWEEVSPYYYALPIGNYGMFVGMNKNSWKKLPADVQKLFLDTHDEACRQAHQIYQGYGDMMLKKMVAEKRMTVTEPSAEDVGNLKKIAKEVIWVKWVKKMEARGLAGQKVLDRWLELLQMHHAKNPF
jgi:TRAP-type C4-dicarboxylate transport system substrate-binding protein